MKEKWKNIKRNFTLKNLLSDSPSRVLMVCLFIILYNLSINKPINNFIWSMFFITFFITISGLSKSKYVKFLEKEKK